jgi:hypothetical protein
MKKMLVGKKTKKQKPDKSTKIYLKYFIWICPFTYFVPYYIRFNWNNNVSIKTSKSFLFYLGEEDLTLAEVN